MVWLVEDSVGWMMGFTHVDHTLLSLMIRTNVAQFAYGLGGLGRQLEALGLTDTGVVDAGEWKGDMAGGRYGVLL